MPGLRRAHDIVGAGVQHVAHRLELGRDAIDELLRRHAFARRGLLNFEAVLVHAGDKQGLAPVEAHEPLDRVGRDALVSMADMRRAIGVGDRRGDVEAAHERRPKAKVFKRRRKSKCSAPTRQPVMPAKAGIQLLSEETDSAFAGMTRNASAILILRSAEGASRRMIQESAAPLERASRRVALRRRSSARGWRSLTAPARSRRSRRRAPEYAACGQD